MTMKMLLPSVDYLWAEDLNTDCGDISKSKLY